VLSEAGSQTK